MRITRIIAIAFIILLLNTQSVFALPMMKSDSLALRALYEAILPSAITNGPASTWRGVTARNGSLGDGRDTPDSVFVLIIRLVDQRTSGELPEEIGNFRGIQTFRIQELNAPGITGGIPETIGNLKWLGRLEIEFCSLDKPIPEGISGCTLLGTLSLNGNRIPGPIPQSIGQLNNLFILSLQSNQITGVPESIGDCSNLRQVYLYDNKLTGAFPSGFYRCPQLEQLSLVGSIDDSKTGNQISGPIEEAFGNITTLKSFGIGFNKITSLPKSIGNLVNLEFLSVRGNLLTEMPPEIGLCSELKSINLAENQITGPIPSTIGQLDSLTSLELDYNLFTSIPPEIGNCLELQQIHLDHNQLTGPIPNEIGNLTRLELLFIDNNVLTGPIPAEIGNCRLLRSVRIQNNQLSGVIPDEIGQLDSLTLLDLTNNQLTGQIPASFGNLAKLTSLDFSGNQFNSTIAPEWGNLTELTTFAIDTAQLYGPIPDEIGGWSQVKYLDFENQRLTTLPAGIGNMESLISLNLKNNEIKSEIPPQIGNISNLKGLDLSHNEITGNIPTEIGNCENLESLWLNHNNLGGTIPETLSNCTKLSRIDMDHNQLTGPLPRTIWNLNRLSAIDVKLNDNQITGVVPKELWQVGNKATRIHLENNLLSGIEEITEESTSVAEIYLDNNQITHIPGSLSKLTNLSKLYIRNNKVTSIDGSLGEGSQWLWLYCQNNKLTSIPGGLGNRRGDFYFQNNQITSLEPFTQNRAHIYIHDNPVTIAGLENSGLLRLQGIYYDPFDLEGDTTRLELRVGDDLELRTKDLPNRGNSTTHQWTLVQYGDFTWGSISREIADTEESFYVYQNIQVADTGYYHITLFNDILNAVIKTVNNPITYVMIIPPPMFPADSLALTLFYQNTGGGAWNKNKNWLSTHATYWEGIVVENGRVTEINLQANNMTGPVPDEIGQLDSLIRFDVFNNQLTSLPDFSSLANLNYLFAAKNALTSIGGLPDHFTSLDLFENQLTKIQGLTGLTQLTKLNLADNQLESLEDLSGLINLTELRLNNNALIELTALPPNLTGLHLENNQLTSLPPFSSALTWLFLGKNQLTAQGVDFSNLSKVTSLNLSENQFSQLPDFSGMNSLRTLVLSGNPLAGNLDFPSMPALATLNLSETGLTDVPDLSALSNLTALGLSGNQLTQIPDVSYLSKLTTLDVQNNGWTELPAAPTMNNIKYIYLDENHLTTLPDLSGLPNLEYLWATKNSLTSLGDLSSLTKLTQLVIFENNLETLPDLSANTRLRTLSAGNNQLTEIANLSDLQSLTEIYLQSNLLASLPELGRAGLHGFNVENNRLTFEDLEPIIPKLVRNYKYGNQAKVGEPATYTVQTGGDVTLSIPIVGGTANVYQWESNGLPITGATNNSLVLNPIMPEHMGLYSCSITNTIATEATLYSEDITVNVMSGTVAALDSIALVALYDSTGGEHWTRNDQWKTGPLNTWYGVTVNDIRVTQLDLSKNNMKGSLPPLLGRLDSLVSFNLRVNQLTDSIPSGFVNLKNLEVVRIDSNDLNHLPVLAGTPKLDTLDVRYNQLMFADIAPHVNIDTLYFAYNPQDSLGMSADTTIVEQSDVLLSINVEGDGNRYQWMKDGAIIESADSTWIVLNSVIPEDGGAYVCRITNDLVSDLILYTRPINLMIQSLSGVENALIPKVYALHQNYPNPFNPVTTIQYELPKTGNVQMHVYNSLGRRVRTLISKNMQPGFHKIEWDATQENGMRAASGLYILELKAGEKIIRKKMMLLK